MFKIIFFYKCKGSLLSDPSIINHLAILKSFNLLKANYCRRVNVNVPPPLLLLPDP